LEHAYLPLMISQASFEYSRIKETPGSYLKIFKPCAENQSQYGLTAKIVSSVRQGPTALQSRESLLPEMLHQAYSLSICQ
jgi:hypothetical protein